MESKHIAMSMEEFNLMEHPFGWKAEYYSGQGHLTPREHIVRTQLQLTSQQQTIQSQNILPIDSSWAELMIPAFFEAFQDSVEFCNWSLDKIYAQGVKNIRDYFQGVRGQPHPMSRMFLELDSPQPIGLALFVTNKEEKLVLDLLFVKPSHHRRGIATQMVTSAIDRLYADGVREILSSYHICNDSSRAWHSSLGFQEIPDYLYSRFKAAWYRNEIWRREKLAITDGLEKLRAKKAHWELLSQELELALWGGADS
jgi:GNAT superfamily N-acetyltransferase